MTEEERKRIVDGLNKTLLALNHWEFNGDVASASVIEMRESILQGLKLIYDQENIIKSLMGDYGDACDVDGCGGDGDAVD